MEEKQQQSGLQTSNQDYVTPTIMQLRLDTQPLLMEMYKYLSGKITTFELQPNGTVIEKIKLIGEQKANDLGVQEIMAQLNSIINPSGVQGNIKEERYDNYVYDAHTGFAMLIIANREVWNISESNSEGIINMFKQIVRTFMTRPIDNEERKSYQKSLVSSESSSVVSRGKLMEFLKA